MFNVVEQPWTLLTLAVIVLLVVLMLQRIFSDKKRWWLLLIPLLLAIAALGLDFLIQTDTEKIKTVIKTAIAAAEQEDSVTIASVVAENYRDSFHINKKRLIHHAAVCKQAAQWRSQGWQNRNVVGKVPKTGRSGANGCPLGCMLAIVGDCRC